MIVLRRRGKMKLFLLFPGIRSEPYDRMMRAAPGGMIHRVGG